MKEIKVTFENGDYLFTKINGTPQEIADYYIDNKFYVGGEMTRAVRIDYL